MKWGLRVNRMAFSSLQLISLDYKLKASTAEPLNREPFSPTPGLETKLFVQNITQ